MRGKNILVNQMDRGGLGILDIGTQLNFMKKVEPAVTESDQCSLQRSQTSDKNLQKQSNENYFIQ